jgi:hypothetical protein
MVRVAFFERRRRGGDGAVAPRRLLAQRSRLLPLAAFAPLALLLEGERGFTLLLGIWGLRRNGLSPGRAIAAFTMAGSSVCFAKPCWNRLAPAPQASSAAFIDGADTARSKKPADVVKTLSFRAIRLPPPEAAGTPPGTAGCG